MLSKVKIALRITSSAYDSEIEDLIEAAKLDLGIAGVENDDLVVGTDPTDKLLIVAIETYCRMRFGSPDNYDKLKASYDEQKAQLATCTGYTDWLVD